MQEFLHILDRGSIHFCAATTLVLTLTVFFRIWYRKTKNKWLPRTMHQTMMYASFTLFMIEAKREPYDVYMGQSVTKAFTDFASWMVGIAYGDWGLHRWRFFNWEE